MTGFYCETCKRYFPHGISLSCDQKDCPNRPLLDPARHSRRAANDHEARGGAA